MAGKKPKRPKVTASLAAWKRYEQKLKDYQEKQSLVKRLTEKAAKLL